MSSVIHPHYIRIIERKLDRWFLKDFKVFYKKWSLWLDLKDLEFLYGVSKKEIILELFRIKNGTPGYYLADFRHQKYYYCGLEFESVKSKLLEIGIGRKDPTEN